MSEQRQARFARYARARERAAGALEGVHRRAELLKVTRKFGHFARGYPPLGRFGRAITGKRSRARLPDVHSRGTGRACLDFKEA